MNVPSAHCGRRSDGLSTTSRGYNHDSRRRDTKINFHRAPRRYGGRRRRRIITHSNRYVLTARERTNFERRLEITTHLSTCLHSHAASAFHDRATLTFDISTSGSIRADGLPYSVRLCTKFNVDSSSRFSFRARTHTGKVTDATDHPTDASAWLNRNFFICGKAERQRQLKLEFNFGIHGCPYNGMIWSSGMYCTLADVDGTATFIQYFRRFAQEMMTA